MGNWIYFRPEPMFENGVSYIDCLPASHDKETGTVSIAGYYNNTAKLERKVLIEGRYIMDNGCLHPVLWSPEVKAWTYFVIWGVGQGQFGHLNNLRVEPHGLQLGANDINTVINMEERLGYGWNEGYEDGKNAFIFFDWNDVNNNLPILAMKLGIAADQNASDILEHLGFSPELHFTDDTAVCSNCLKLIYTADGSYQEQYEDTEDGIFCADCIHTGNDSIQDSVISSCVNRPHKATTVLYNYELNAAGFKQIGEDYENGWYGTVDDPMVIMKHLHERWSDVLFQVKGSNPFSTKFSAWVREEKEGAMV